MAKSLGRRIGRILARVSLGLVVFILGLLLLVTLAMDLAPVRELVRKQANAELGKILEGTVTLERIGELGFRGVGEGRSDHVLARLLLRRNRVEPRLRCAGDRSSRRRTFLQPRTIGSRHPHGL